jgi:molybdate transport system permease protein
MTVARPGASRRAGSSLTAVALIVAALLGLPVAALVARAGLDGSLAGAASSRVVLDALALSLGTTAVSVGLTIVLGLPLAWVLARHRFPGKGWVEAVVDLPIVLRRSCWCSVGAGSSAGRSTRLACRSPSPPRR